MKSYQTFIRYKIQKEARVELLKINNINTEQR